MCSIQSHPSVCFRLLLLSTFRVSEISELPDFLLCHLPVWAKVESRNRPELELLPFARRHWDYHPSSCWEAPLPLPVWVVLLTVQEEPEWDIPEGPWLRLRLPMQGVRVWSLIRELRSHKPHSQKPKHKTEANVVTKSIKTLKTVHIKKKNLKKKNQGHKGMMSEMSSTNTANVQGKHSLNLLSRAGLCATSNQSAWELKGPSEVTLLIPLRKWWTETPKGKGLCPPSPTST